MGASTAKRFAFAAFAVALGFAGSLLALELALRLLPVNRGLRALPVDAANPVLRFTPDRTSTFSRQWNLVRPVIVRNNNDGFVSLLDYDASATSPLVAVIGDSYVEAVMVPQDETVGARLARAASGRGRVYTFGASGSPLSQYLAYADYAHRKFRPSGMAFTIVANDFDESLVRYKNVPGFHYFVDGGDGELALRRIDYAPPLSVRLVRESALAMYVALNLNGKKSLDRLLGRVDGGADAGSAPADATRVSDSRRAVDAFLRLLPSIAGLEPSDIVLAVDGIRPAIYDGSRAADAEPYFHEMRGYFVAGARARGFEVIDLHEEFGEHYRRHRQRFEFPDDAHWNGVGHGVVADAMRRSAMFRRRIAPGG